MTSREEKKNLIEGALFMGDSVPIEELMEISGATEEEVHEIIKELRTDYKDRAVEIVRIKDEYKLGVKNDINEEVSHLAPHADISPGPLRTLAIIAFKQPVKQSEIVKVQGNRVYDYVKELEERELIESEKEGRTKVLSTSPEFESYFGMSSEELKELKKKKGLGVEDDEEGDDES